MARFTLKKYVEAPPEKVFQLLTDFSRLPEVVEAIQKIDVVTDGPVGVGTKFNETRVMFKREATELMEITAFDSPRSFTLSCNSCGAQMDSVHTLTPMGEGTEIELSLSAKPLSFFAKMMSFMTKFMLKGCIKAVEKDLDNIKVAVETS